MTKEEIYNYFYTNSANLGVQTILMCLIAGLIISLLICITYKICNKGVAYNAKFNTSLIVILLVAIIIMLMISSNIVISLGMVGALSIIRFRTAIKDSKDTVFIFWAIAEGLSVGSQNFKLALITTLFISAILIGTGIFPLKDNKYLMVIAGSSKSINHKKLIEVLDEKTKSYKLRAATSNDTHQEFIYEIKVKKEITSSFLNEIRSIEGITSVNTVVESSDMVG